MLIPNLDVGNIRRRRLVLWTSPVGVSASMCAFMPNCHLLTFFVDDNSSPRALDLFFVERMARMIVALATVSPNSTVKRQFYKTSIEKIQLPLAKMTNLRFVRPEVRGHKQAKITS